MAADFTVRGDTSLDASGFSAGVKKLGGVAAKGFAVIGGAAAAATGVLAKASFDAYSSYEQLVGGVETLFKTSDAVVMEYAKNAYKTAGMSANQYMDTVTSFSARLLQGLGGDTKAAADIANVAITDMADNANKMGSDIKSIQDAYQGFAKQNYTMLDNLKLGYGGTQSEMARLINESGVLGDAMTVTAETVNDVSFDKIIEAIHVVQENLGITGTTALEASTTIQGSVSQMSAAWENLVTGMADQNQDLDALMDEFVNSVQVVGSNVIPVIGQMLPRIATAISQLGSDLLPIIPQTIGSLLPAVIDGAEGLVSGFVTILPDLVTTGVQSIPQLADAAVSIIGNLGGALVSAAPSLVNGILQLAPSIMGAVTSLADMLVQGVQSMMPSLAENVTSFLSEMLPQLLDFSGVLREKIGELVDVGLQLIQNLWQGIVDALPELLANVPQIITNIAGVINDNFPKILTTGVQMIITLIKGIIQAIPDLLLAIPDIIVAIVSVFMAFNWVGLGKNIIGFFRDGIKGMIGAVKNAADDIFKNITGSLKNLPHELMTLAKTAGSNIVNAFKSINWLDLGKNIVMGIVRGISNAAGSLINMMMDLAKSALDSVLDFFGIHSPSRVMRDKVGRMLPKGMAIGVELETPKAANVARQSAGEMVAAAQDAVSASQRTAGAVAQGSGTASPSVFSASWHGESMTIIEMDGRTVGKAVAPYVDQFLW